jgi:hypothetical protein
MPVQCRYLLIKWTVFSGRPAGCVAIGYMHSVGISNEAIKEEDTTENLKIAKIAFKFDCCIPWIVIGPSASLSRHQKKLVTRLQEKVTLNKMRNQQNVNVTAISLPTNRSDVTIHVSVEQKVVSAMYLLHTSNTILYLQNLK